MTYPEPPAQGDTLPAVSPNGRFLVFQRVLGSNVAELHLLPLGDGMSAAGPPLRIASVAVSGKAPAWTPRSDEIVFSAQGGLWRMGITGAQAPVRLPFGEDGLMPAVSIPQPGKPSRLAYVRSFSDVNIYKVETPAVGAPASAQPSVAIASTRIDRGARFSPDGRRVAFTSDRSGWQEIWISDPDGSGAAQLTFLKAPNAAVPTWSPDGQTIAFESSAEGQNEIYSMSSGGGKPRRLTTHPANDKIPSFSRDGKWIYFHSDRSRENQIWKVPAAGGEPRQVTYNTGNMALESIDGAWLYYTLFTSPSSLWRIPASGGPAEKILDSIFARDFDVVEQGIYYLEPSPSGGIRLQFFQFDSRKSTNVTQLDERGRQFGNGLSASPDGRTILFTRTDSSIMDLMLVENFR